VLLVCFFKGGTEDKGWRLHANEGWQGFFFVAEAGDRGGWGLVGLVDQPVGGHCLSVAGAVVVLAGKGSREGVFVGDVAMEHWVQTVGILVQEAMRDKDGELVGGVRVRAKQASKIDVTDGGPLSFGVELGLSAVTQLGD